MRGWRRRGKRRAMEWLSWKVTQDITDPKQGLLVTPGDRLGFWILTPGEVRDFFDEPTIVRNIVRNSILGAVDPSGSSQIGGYYAEGLITWKQSMDNDSAPSDPTELPNMFTGDADFLYYNTIWLGDTVNGSQRQFFAGFASVGQADTFDLRSKRKLEDGEGYLYVVESHSGSDINIIMNTSGRVLLANK